MKYSNNIQNSGSNEPDRNNQDIPSFASIAAGSSSMQNRRDSVTSANFERRNKLESKFVTPAPEGGMRDEITVEVQTVNEKPFKGSLTFDEALNGIFVHCLELDTKILHGIRFRYSGCPTIKYKLKMQINVDELKRSEYFEFYRHYKVRGEERYDTFGCKISGIRSAGEPFTQADSDPSIRWLKIEWAEYSVEKAQIVEWLAMYGEPVNELTEDVHPNSDSDADQFGTGTYSIKMRLTKEVPQLLPMWGKRIRVYYRGVQKLCPNCFGPHARRNCKSEKVSWIQYVLKFMESNPEIPAKLYGKWWKIVNDEFGEIIQEDGPQATETEPEVTPTNNQNASESANDAPQNNVPRERLSRQETDNLSDYLRIGMSIADARQAFQKEIEMAEIKQKIRESKRQENSYQSGSRTRIGDTTNSGRRGRGGLSFN